MISQRGALDKREAVDIMMQLTSAVQHAHENQIIHRDIKPQNVLVKDDGTVKITDFGIALAHDAVQLTQNDAVLGSAHYLAPETTRGEPASNQIDIYALGIVFYELLSGSVPFKGENPVQIAMKHLREDVPGIRDFNPTLPQTIENIIIKATVKNRKLRYQTAQEMLNDLKLCLMPEYANTAKLVFSETEAQPTVNVREPGNYPTESGKKKAEVVEEIVDTKKKGSKKGLWITLGILIATIITAIILYFSGVFNFFSYDPLIPVPSITDLTKEEALLKLTEAGFQESDIIFSEELSEATETGHVFDSDPKEGSEVRRRDGIQVMISKGNFYVLPDFKGKSLAEAEAELKKALPLAVISKETVATAENQPDEILEQSGPKIGDKLSPEKEVTIFFKVAKAPSLTIPNLIGEEIEAAKAKLESYGVYVVLYQRPTVGMSEEEIKALETGVVVEVDPPKGTEYKQDGSSNWITLYYY